MDTSDSLIQFPCDYLFKAVGSDEGEGAFLRAVHRAVSEVVPVPIDSIKCRPSSQGNYLAVSVLVRLYNMEQVHSIYASLRGVAGLKFLL
ncbi:MAG: YbeD family protein [Desulfuromonadales bacterium]|uniref:YbeD family protein n=1 Tax=Desulfuromonas sp. KJ2020 TaxID=2919173 RepID=UPI0020A7128C|nr:DUF493 domain-containing protein [Desulfuromonas sp. KJ2020]MCP3178104.1 DUF493 domain-containing protein [Desulfuromonas sp. KJ2020]